MEERSKKLRLHFRVDGNWEKFAVHSKMMASVMLLFRSIPVLYSVILVFRQS